MSAASRSFIESVFHVPSPTCPTCHKETLDFMIYLDYGGSGDDWCVWYCNTECGFQKAVKME